MTPEEKAALARRLIDRKALHDRLAELFHNYLEDQRGHHQAYRHGETSTESPFGAILRGQEELRQRGEDDFGPTVFLMIERMLDLMAENNRDILRILDVPLETH